MASDRARRGGPSGVSGPRSDVIPRGTPPEGSVGRVDLGGRPPRSPTGPDVHVKCIRFVTLWNRCPSHDWVVSR